MTDLGRMSVQCRSIHSRHACRAPDSPVDSHPGGSARKAGHRLYCPSPFTSTRKCPVSSSNGLSMLFRTPYTAIITWSGDCQTRRFSHRTPDRFRDAVLSGMEAGRRGLAKARLPLQSLAVALDLRACFGGTLTASEAKVSTGSIDPGRYLTPAAAHQELGCSTCTQPNLNRRRSTSVKCSKP